MARLLIPTNPCSKRNKRLESIRELKAVAKRYPQHEIIFIEIPIATSGHPQDIVEAYATAMRPYLVQGNIDGLLGNSGDSGHLYIDSALGRLGYLHLPQGNLRGGTVNERGENSNFPHRSIRNRLWGPETTNCHTLRIILEAYEEGEPLRTVPRNLLRVQTTEGVYNPFCVGGGFVTNFFDRYETAGATHPAAIKEILKGATQAGVSLLPGINLIDDLKKPCDVKLQIDQRVLTAEQYLGFMITSLDIVMDFGPLELGVEDLIGTKDRPDFRIAYCQEGSLVQLAKNLPRVLGIKRHFTPKPLKHPDIVTQNASFVKLTPGEPIHLILDGELMTFEGPIFITPSEEVPYITI